MKLRNLFCCAGASAFLLFTPAPHNSSSQENQNLEKKIHVVFSPSLHYKEDRIDNQLIQLLNDAQERADIAIYDLNLKGVKQAVLEARRRGVEVRIVTDSDNFHALEDLVGVPIVQDNRSAFMHNKFCVVDNKIVWTGSYNFTFNGTFKNDNNAVYFLSEKVARNYETEFEEMFNGSFGRSSPKNTPFPHALYNNTEIETYFAPEDGVAKEILEEIAEAKNSIYFLAFSFTSDEIGEAMIKKSEQGVEVKGIFEKRQISKYSEYERMEEAGLEVYLDKNPAAMHNKVIIIDNKTVITGSYNFSKNAEQRNDENVLIIHNKDIAREYLDEFYNILNVKHKD